MSMGDVFAFFGAMLAIGIALPGLLLAWLLVFPHAVERARLRLGHTPWRCFWLGAAWLAASALPIAVLLRIPAGPVKLIGWIAILVLLALASLGAAGLALLMGERLCGTDVPASTAGALLRGAITLELAAVFPLIGWFIVIPLVSICALGAAGFALLRRAPRPEPEMAVAGGAAAQTP